MPPEKKAPTINKKKRDSKRPPKRPTATYLRNVAVYYLQRYAATSHSLQQVLQRRILRASKFYDDLDSAALHAAAAKIGAEMVQLGYVNDVLFAEQKISSLRRAGKSARAIQAKLASKGLKVALNDDVDSELAAALTHARKKKLGAYRTRPVENAMQKALWNKDLAAMARAGFSRAIATQALKGAH